MGPFVVRFESGQRLVHAFMSHDFMNHDSIPAGRAREPKASRLCGNRLRSLRSLGSGTISRAPV